MDCCCDSGSGGGGDAVQLPPIPAAGSRLPRPRS